MTNSKRTYYEMLKSELLALAQRLRLTSISRLRKDEIINRIKKVMPKSTKTSSIDKTKASTDSTYKKVSTMGKIRAKRTTAKAASQIAPTKHVAKETTKPLVEPNGLNHSEAPADDMLALQDQAMREKKQKKTSAQAMRYPQKQNIHVPPSPPVSEQADAVASKFSSAPSYRPEELQGVDEQLPELPDSYDENRIVLMPRDPTWLFTYWNLTHEYKEAARAAGGRALALRLFDVTDIDFDGSNSLATYEHECAEWARSWYLPSPAPSREFIVEIGYRGENDWFPLARSTRVTVPSDQPSTWIKDQCATINFHEDLNDIHSRFQMDSEPPKPPLSPEHHPFQAQQMLFDDGQIRIVVGGRLLTPSGAPNWPIFSQILAGGGEFAGIPGSLGQIPGSLGQIPGSLGQIPGSLGQIPGSLGQIPGSLGQIPGSLGQIPGSLGQIPPGNLGQFPGSPGLFGASPTEFPRQTVFEASDVAVLGNGGFLQQPFVLEHSNKPMVQASIELVICGRSFPDTDLSIAGRTIPVGPDGAFSLRVSVPKGVREIPIEARSKITEETRRINLTIGSQFE